MQGTQPEKDGIDQNLIRIAVISLVLYAVMLACYAALGRFSLPVVLGGLIGLAAALLNLWLLGKAVRRVTQMEDTVLAQSQMRSSYTTRMLGQAGAAVLAFVIPQADGIACIIALLLPRMAVMALQFLEKRKKS